MPTRILTNDARVKLSSGDYDYLEKGAYVSVIRKYWVREKPFGNYDEEIYTAIYCSKGLALIEKANLE